MSGVGLVVRLVSLFDCCGGQPVDIHTRHCRNALRVRRRSG